MAPPMIWPGGIFNPVCASLLNMISWIEPSSVTTQLKPWPAQARGTQLRKHAVGVCLGEKINLLRSGSELRSEFLPARRTVACSRTGMHFDRLHSDEHVREVTCRRHATGRITERDVDGPRIGALHRVVYPATADDHQGDHDDQRNKEE